PEDVRDDAVVARAGVLHHAGVTVDLHARTLARGCDRSRPGYRRRTSSREAAETTVAPAASAWSRPHPSEEATIAGVASGRRSTSRMTTGSAFSPLTEKTVRAA